MKIAKILSTLAAAGILFMPCPASSTITSFTATGDVPDNCSTVTVVPSSMSFANYDPFTFPSGTPDYFNSGIVLSTSCTRQVTGNTVTWTVSIGSNCGKGPGPANDRAMRIGSTTSYLSYELYSAPNGGGSAYNTNLCGTPAANATQSAGGTVSQNQFSIYGLIPGGQNVKTGSYSDSITVTLNY